MPSPTVIARRLCDEAISRSLALWTARLPRLVRNDKGDGCHCEEPCDEAISQSITLMVCRRKEASPLDYGH